MTAFNPRYLARQVPASTWRSYLISRSIAIPESFDWSAEEKAFSDALIGLFEGLKPAHQVRLHAELRRVHALSTAKGMDAFLNASDQDSTLREELASLRNDAERALWVLVHWMNTFLTAEVMLQFDLGVGKRSWKRQAIQVSELVSRDPADIEGLQAALSAVLSQRKGPRRACQVDVCDRHLDGGVQVSVYLEDDPNDLVEFVEEGMCRRTTRPVAHLALVYYSDSGLVDSVGRGGAKVHRALVTLFARHLLGQEVRPEAVKQPMFFLNRLRYGLDLPEDSDIDPAALGIEHIRLRRARLRSTRAPIGDFWVGASTEPTEPCALGMSRAHLRDRDLFRGPFNLVEALVTVYFRAPGAGKRGRVLNIELKQSGISNLQDMEEGDAKLAERLLRAWRVCQPTAVELALVA